MKNLGLIFIAFIGITILTSHRDRTYAESGWVRHEKLGVLDVDSKPVTLFPIEKIEPLEVLIDALIIVESQGDDSAVGDKHLSSPSIGVLQIRPIMVREVNRILKIEGVEKRFTLKDRWSKEKSIEMFMIWQDYHHSDSDFESIARSWNGGSKGPENPRTLKYWEKVKQELEK